MIMPFPCYKTLYNNFKDEEYKYKSPILNFDHFTEILREKEILYEEKCILTVLTYDAFTITIFKKIKKIKETNKYCSIFLYQPFNSIPFKIQNIIYFC